MNPVKCNKTKTVTTLIQLTYVYHANLESFNKNKYARSKYPAIAMQVRLKCADSTFISHKDRKATFYQSIITLVFVSEILMKFTLFYLY